MLVDWSVLSLSARAVRVYRLCESSSLLRSAVPASATVPSPAHRLSGHTTAAAMLQTPTASCCPWRAHSSCHSCTDTHRPRPAVCTSQCAQRN